jgi:MFS family permease
MAMRVLNRERGANQETLASDLAPIDGGKDAWIFLLASFSFEFIIWGQAYGYGSYLDYHTNNPKSPLYQQSTASISAIGTLVIGGQHFVPLLARGFFRAYPRLIRVVSTTCICLSALSILIASFMDNVVYLILFQGIFFGISSGITFTPVILWLSQWFDKRRGLATGIIYSGSGLGGIVFPIIITKLLNAVGFAWTLRIMALMSFTIGSLASMALKPRLPVSTASNPFFSMKDLLPGNLTALVSPFAGLSEIVLFLQACAWYTISLYISTYTTSLGFSSSTATGVLSAFNASATVGYLIIGRLIDIAPYNVVIIASTTMCSLSAFILLGFAHSLPLVFVFVLIFGLSGGGFSTFMTAISRDLAAFSKQESATLYLALIFIRGLAAVSGPLIGAALYDPTKNSFRVYGTKGFRGIVLWVGSAMIFSAIAAAFAMQQRTRKIRSIDQASLQTH